MKIKRHDKKTTSIHKNSLYDDFIIERLFMFNTYILLQLIIYNMTYFFRF